MKKGLFFYAILASVLWAIVNPFIKQGLSYDFSPMNFAGIRFTTVGIILFFAYTWHKGMWKGNTPTQQTVSESDPDQYVHGVHRFLFRSRFRQRGYLFYHYGNDTSDQCTASPSAGQQ